MRPPRGISTSPRTNSRGSSAPKSGRSRAPSHPGVDTLRQGADSTWNAVMGMTRIRSLAISLRHELTPGPERSQTGRDLTHRMPARFDIPRYTTRTVYPLDAQAILSEGDRNCFENGPGAARLPRDPRRHAARVREGPVDHRVRRGAVHAE